MGPLHRVKISDQRWIRWPKVPPATRGRLTWRAPGRGGRRCKGLCGSEGFQEYDVPISGCLVNLSDKVVEIMWRFTYLYICTHTWWPAPTICIWYIYIYIHYRVAGQCIVHLPHTAYTWTFRVWDKVRYLTCDRKIIQMTQMTDFNTMRSCWVFRTCLCFRRKTWAVIKGPWLIG